MNTATLARKLYYGKVYGMPESESGRNQFSNYTDPETGVKCVFKSSKKCQRKIAAAKTKTQVQQQLSDTKSSNMPLYLGIGGGVLLLVFVSIAISRRPVPVKS